MARSRRISASVRTVPSGRRLTSMSRGLTTRIVTHGADQGISQGFHPRRPDVAAHGPDAGVGEDGVEGGGEVRSAVADHELDPISLFTEVHEQVPGLLGGPHLNLDPQAGQFAVDPAVCPSGVLAGQPEDECPDISSGRRPAGLAAQGPSGPAAADDIAVPRQDRLRRDQ
jgi:hypothetical protein